MRTIMNDVQANRKYIMYTIIIYSMCLLIIRLPLMLLPCSVVMNDTLSKGIEIIEHFLKILLWLLIVYY